MFLSRGKRIALIIFSVFIALGIIVLVFDIAEFRSGLGYNLANPTKDAPSIFHKTLCRLQGSNHHYYNVCASDDSKSWSGDNYYCLNDLIYELYSGSHDDSSTCMHFTVPGPGPLN